MAKKAPQHVLYTPEKLLELWRAGKLAVEQTLEQLLYRVIDCIKQLATLRAQQLNAEQRDRDFERRLQALEKRCP